MSFTDIGLNEDFAKRIISHINSGRISASYIFVGLPERGGLEISLAFAKSVNCEFGINFCNNCKSCRMINNSTHPDIKIYSPGTQKFGISVVRQIQQDSSETNYSAKYRFNILQSCETMTIEAQNALLKMLEEGRKGCLNILLAKSLEGLLQTILSRSIILKLPPLKLDVSSTMLQNLGMPKDLADNESIAFDGDIRLPAWIAKNNEKAEFAMQIISTIGQGKVFNIATLCDDEENLEHILLLFEETIKCAKRLRCNLEVDSQLLRPVASKLAYVSDVLFENAKFSLKEIEKIWKTQSKKSMLTQSKMFHAWV